MNSISQTKTSKKLITSQRQVVVKLFEKTDKDKCFIKNWKPMSLLKVDQKITSKVFSARLKVGLSASKKSCVIFFIESPLKMMKNAFYFILKALFVLKIFKFLS